jgi:hypothetical protein
MRNERSASELPGDADNADTVLDSLSERMSLLIGANRYSRLRSDLFQRIIRSELDRR